MDVTNKKHEYMEITRSFGLKNPVASKSISFIVGKDIIVLMERRRVDPNYLVKVRSRSSTNANQVPGIIM